MQFLEFFIEAISLVSMSKETKSPKIQTATAYLVVTMIVVAGALFWRRIFIG